jgi:Domain of unknown function (DUF3536)/Glycosyl hydrolase family 57
MSDLEFCIHGHFYQPPREDPLTGLIPDEPGAAPFRNWNQKIDAECYRPNAELGNFEKISFNIGPTMFSWLEINDPDSYEKILKQDRVNHSHFGIGNAMAQGYNHTILPLASHMYKVTQVKWGIADFKHRFGHAPMGMWLPEAAVDYATLEVLADCGILYTILAPWQADTPQVDTGEAYQVALPNGKKIAAFFYDQDLSTRISFDPGATRNADSFLLNYLLPKFRPKSSLNGNAQLIMIASDGELYGHHQQFREKFLERLLNGALVGQPVKTTFPGLWLREHPATKWMGIHENSSWSCHHGVVRWMGDCACTPGGGQWKTFLRTGLNQIASDLDKVYSDTVSQYLADPWQLRHEYIHVFLGEVRVGEYIQSMIGQRLGEDELKRIALLLQSQFERQRMFTSCGWFFEDFDRIEPRNNITHAAQAAWLSFQATGSDLTREAVELFHNVKSQRTGLRGDQVFYEKYLKAEKKHDLDSSQGF